MSYSVQAMAREGWIALSIALIVVVVWFFPSPIVIYFSCLVLFVLALERAHRWLKRLITTWPRVAASGIASLVLLVGFFLGGPERTGLFEHSQLRPNVFAYWAVLLTTVELFVLFASSLRDLWRKQERKP